MLEALALLAFKTFLVTRSTLKVLAVENPGNRHPSPMFPIHPVISEPGIPAECKLAMAGLLPNGRKVWELTSVGLHVD
jgi:hypothetical protein